MYLFNISISHMRKHNVNLFLSGVKLVWCQVIFCPRLAAERKLKIPTDLLFTHSGELFVYFSIKNLANTFVVLELHMYKYNEMCF